MVSVPAFGLNSLGFSPGQEHCVAFLGKKSHSQSGSLHPGLHVCMGTSKYNAGGNPVMNYQPIQGAVEILLLVVVSCYRNQKQALP